LARQADGAEAAAMVRAELLATALQFQLVTELTSRVAVDRTVSRRPGDSLESVAVPQAVPVDQGGEAEEMIIVLTPFTVDASKDTGYRATQTLAGTRIATELADVGSSISVLTSEFLRDINGTNNETTLAYAVSTEVGGARGNYSGGVSVQGNALGGAGDETAKMANPNQNTRVRGLTAADNTRNMFLNDIPWDIYNVGRVDLQRGPNSMLFGLGSPAGIINVTINSAEFRDRGTIGASYDQFGSIRMSLDYNKELIDQQLALRVQYLDNNQKFRQEPAFSDDTRYFAAAAFAPEMLNREGMVFTVNANFEKGKIVSNRPRYIAPMDAMTRFFAPRSEGGVNRQTADHLNGNVLDNRSPSFNPAYSEFFTYDPVYDVETNTWELHRPIQMGSRMTDGSIWLPRQGDNGPWPGPYANELRMGGMAEFAARSNLAFSDFGSYTWFESLQDPSVFDFYNKLIDGDNKREFTDWDVLDINIAHTFFDGKVGCNLAYFNQKLVQDQWAMLGWGATLHVDVNSYDNVFTYNPEARGGVGLVANPNAGRVYVSQPVNFTNPCLESNREAGRFQAFVNHDFAKGNKTFLNRLLGEHRVTASVARETQSTDSRSRRTWQFDLNSMRNFASNAVVGDKGGRHIGVTSGGDAFVTDWRYYLSEDVRSRSSAVGLNLPNMTRTFLGKGGSAEVWKFDNTWTAGPSVDPNAFWQNPNPEATAPGVSHYWRQAANPFNYQGWYNAQGQRNMVPVNVVTLFSDQLVEGMTAKDYLTVDAELMETIDDSFTAVWQACFWDKAVVGTFGYRHDEVEVDQYGSGRTRTPSHEHPITQGADVDPNRYRLDGVADRTGTVDQTNWSVVAHLNRFLGDNDFIPINVSVLYNHGENAQPRFGRVDMIGDPLPAPVGDTDEWGLRLSTKDEKYSLQIAKYETISIKQDSTQNLSATYVIEQMMSGCANLARGFRSGANGYDSYYNWADPNRLYPREYERLMTRVIPDWILFEQQIQERWPGFVAGWIKGPWGSATDNGWVSCAQPWGFARTETAQSKGWEIEFVANPLENWRIMANAAQMEARRYEVMGTKAREVMDFIIDQVNSDDRVFGDTPIWWPGNNRVFSPPGYVNEFGYGPTFGGRGGLRGTISPYGDFKREWQMILALEGQKARELREWRFNLVSTYDFQSGALEGVSVGGGYRWEDGSVIGYAPEYRQPSGAAVYRRPYVDLDAPVETDSNGTLDLWLGKTFKLSAKMTWRVQLNVNNVFGRNELEAVSTGVDAVALQSMGTIEPDTVIPMRDGIMLIREGRSWTLSSTLEF
jgi:outer membrane receptor protein involved in Fe transport